MGSRAIFVIIEDGALELYYDHWGAQGLSLDLVLDGEHETVERIRRMTVLDPTSARSWLDDVWGEGGLVLDLTNRMLVWFDVPFEALNPRVANYLIERTWTGWTAIWAPEGMRAILRLLRIDLDPTGNPREASMLSGDFLTAGDRPDAVLSVRFGDGVVRSLPVTGWLDELTRIPWREVIAFAADAGAKGDGAAEQVAVSGSGVCQGFYVDVDERRLSWWSDISERHHFAQVSEYWPGFDVVCHGDDYVWHEEVAGICGLHTPIVDVLADTHAMLEKVQPKDEQKNLGREMSAWLVEEGVKLELNPAIDSYVPARRIAGRASAHQALQVLRNQEVVDLPRARYIDAQRRIVSPYR